MPNRNQNYQSGSQRHGRSQPRDEDDNRSRNWDRDYGQSGESDYDENSRSQYGQQRDTSEQSGSTGRYAGYGDFGQGEYGRGGRSTGQDHYGQTGYGQGGYGQGQSGQPNYSYGQPSYGQDYGSSGTSSYGRSFGASRSGSSGSPGGWREPSGEGQQYGSGQQYGYGDSSRGQGLHRGKGPKNYQRSDERVKELLCERLHEDPEIDASEVTVNVQGGKITLEGTVDSRRTKNAIEDVAEQIGSQDVQNNLRVQRSGEKSGMESTNKTSMSGKSGLSTDDGEQSKQKRN